MAEDDFNERARALVEGFYAKRPMTLGQWIDDPQRPFYADSVDEHGRLDFVWRFRFERDEDIEQDGNLYYRRGTWHPDGKSQYRQGFGPQGFKREMERLGIRLDLPVSASYSM